LESCQELASRILKDQSTLQNFKTKYEISQHLEYNLSHIIVKHCCYSNRNEICSYSNRYENTLLYNNIPFGVMSGNLSFILTIKSYTRQLNI
jgi:hypothetical protein